MTSDDPAPSEDDDGEGETRNPADSLSDPADAVADPSDSVTDPAEHVPEVEAPEVGVDPPEVPEPEDVPEELRAEFWEIVLAVNVALFALALGAFLVGFNGDLTRGGLSLAVGTLAAGYAFHAYRNREHAP